MNILIVGIDGYIGVQMAHVLGAHGHYVTGIDTGFYREGWLYNDAVSIPRIINKDTRNVQLDDLRGYDAIVHLADLSNDPLGQHDPKLTFEINHNASIRLATLAKKAGVKRFVYSSSCSVYGIASEDYVNEQSPVNPQTAYAKCKVLAETDLRALADDNFSPTILRSATVYGPSPRMRFDLVVNNLSGLAYTTELINMTSDGTPWRPLVHILDVCEAFACAVDAPIQTIHNQTFNVGNSKGNYQIKDIANIVAEVFSGCTFSFGNSVGDTRSYRVNFEKITYKLPNFKSTRDVRMGVVDLKNMFEQVKLTKELFDFRSYTRIKALDHLLATGQIDSKLFWQ